MSAPVTLADLLAAVRGSPLDREIQLIREALAGHPDRVYLIGGMVRDLLLGRESKDVDLGVAGDVEGAVEKLAPALGGAVRRHPPFMTARIDTERGFAVDLARLRREHYSEPAALPRVEAGTLAEDLFRRDFSVNAMAVDLARESSRVIDLHDGFEDLAAGRLRVLHDQSFRDDPTRVLRGVRHEIEIGLAFDRETAALAAADATSSALRRVSGFRLWREISYCFRDAAAAERAIRRFEELGLGRALHPELSSSDNLAVELERAAGPEGVDWSPARGLAAWAADLDRPERFELAERLALRREERVELGVAAATHERVRRGR